MKWMQSFTIKKTFHDSTFQRESCCCNAFSNYTASFPTSDTYCIRSGIKCRLTYAKTPSRTAQRYDNWIWPVHIYSSNYRSQVSMLCSKAIESNYFTRLLLLVSWLCHYISYWNVDSSTNEMQDFIVQRARGPRDWNCLTKRYGTFQIE